MAVRANSCCEPAEAGETVNLTAPDSREMVPCKPMRV